MNFILHITYNTFIIIIQKITNIIIPVLVKYKMVNSLSFLIILSLKKIEVLKPKNKMKYKVLVLSKIGGIDDLLNMPKNKNKDILFLECQRSIFKNIFFSIHGVKDKKELSIKKNKVLKKKYIEFLIKVLAKINKIYKINCIIGFNYNYFAEKDLQIVCKKLKISFLLLYKESVITKGEEKYLQYAIKKSGEKFNGHKIAVYSNNAKKDFYQSNFFNKKNIDIVGCSRLSKSFYYKNKIPKKQIVYYAIQKDRGLPHRFLKIFGNNFFKDFKYHKEYNANINWGDLNTSTLKILKKFAINNPKIIIIIKVKLGYYEDIKYLNLPKNIKYEYDGTGHHLLETCKVVIGWNTTAILEGIAANRFILLPYFYSKKNKLKKDCELTLKLKNENYGYTEDDFYKKLDFFVKKKYTKNQIYNNQYALKHYLHNSDNKAGLRLFQFIKKNITKS